MSIVFNILPICHIPINFCLCFDYLLRTPIACSLDLSFNIHYVVLAHILDFYFEVISRIKKKIVERAVFYLLAVTISLFVSFVLYINIIFLCPKVYVVCMHDVKHFVSVFIQ